MAQVLNLQKAKAMGFSDEDINAYLKKNPQLGVRTTSQTVAAQQGQQPQSQPNEGNLIERLLPLIGSILGGTLAAPLPGGLIWGSAAGSGLGELGRQTLTGNYDIKKILGETGSGAIGGLGAHLLGNIGKIGKAGTEIAGEAAGKAGTLGTRVAAKPYTSEALRMFKGTNVAERAAETGATAAGVKGLTAPTKLTNIGNELKGLNETLRTITRTAGEGGMARTSVKGTEIFNKVVTNADSFGVDLTSGTGKTLIGFWGPKIKRATSVSKLSKLNEDMLTKLAKIGINSERGQALQAIQQPITEELGRITNTADIFARRSALKTAEKVVQKVGNKVTTGPFSMFQTGFPQRLGEAGQAIAGKGLDLAATPTGRLIGSQLATKTFLGNGTSAESGYNPPQEPSAYAPTETPTQKAGLNITPEQVALAQLALPPKQANAIMAAYKVLNPAKAQSAMEESLGKANISLNHIEKLSGKLGYGPLQGNLYALEMFKTGGAGVPDDVAEKYQAYETLRIQVVRAMQGARISDKDIEQSAKYIPNISDTDRVVRIKLRLIKELLTNLPSVAPSTDSTSYYQTD